MTDLTREQERALVEALERGVEGSEWDARFPIGSALETWAAESGLWEKGRRFVSLSGPDVRLFNLSDAGRIAAQALKERDQGQELRLAGYLIERLNNLCEDKDARETIVRLCEDRRVVPDSLASHPSIVVRRNKEEKYTFYTLGLVGLLNGFFDTCKIARVLDDETGEHLRFEVLP